MSAREVGRFISHHRVDTEHFGGASAIREGISIVPLYLFGDLTTVGPAATKGGRERFRARAGKRPIISMSTHRMTIQWQGAKSVIPPYALGSIIR